MIPTNRSTARAEYAATRSIFSSYIGVSVSKTEKCTLRFGYANHSRGIGILRQPLNPCCELVKFTVLLEEKE